MWLCLCWAVALIYSKVYMLPVVLFYCFGFSRWQKGKFLHVVSMQIKKLWRKELQAGIHGNLSRVWCCGCRPGFCMGSSACEGHPCALALWGQGEQLRPELWLGGRWQWSSVICDCWNVLCIISHCVEDISWVYKAGGRVGLAAAFWLARHAGLFLRAPQTRAQGLAIPSSFLNLLQPPWTFSHSGCSSGRALLLRVTEGVEGHAGVCDLFLAFEVTE